MHFWIDKRSQNYGHGVGRARINNSFGGGMGGGFGHPPRRSSSAGKVAGPSSGNTIRNQQQQQIQQQQMQLHQQHSQATHQQGHSMQQLQRATPPLLRQHSSVEQHYMPLSGSRHILQQPATLQQQMSMNANLSGSTNTLCSINAANIVHGRKKSDMRGRLQSQQQQYQQSLDHQHALTEQAVNEDEEPGEDELLLPKNEQQLQEQKNKNINVEPLVDNDRASGSMSLTLSERKVPDILLEAGVENACISEGDTPPTNTLATATGAPISKTNITSSVVLGNRFNAANPGAAGMQHNYDLRNFHHPQFGSLAVRHCGGIMPPMGRSAIMIPDYVDEQQMHRHQQQQHRLSHTIFG